MISDTADFVLNLIDNISSISALFKMANGLTLVLTAQKKNALPLALTF